MLTNDRDDRSHMLDLGLATVLALVAGGVNGAGFIAYGFFSANMTGNVSMVSDLLTQGHWRAAFGFSVIVSMFIFGAFVASLMIAWGRRRGLTQIYTIGLSIEASLLAAAGAVAALHDDADGHILVALLALSMGMQNGLSSRLSAGRVRTTHVSGVSTDLGAALADLLHAAEADLERRKIRRRLVLHATTIASFLAGGVVGVAGYGLIGDWIFCLLATPIALSCLLNGRITGPRSHV